MWSLVHRFLIACQRMGCFHVYSFIDFFLFVWRFYRGFSWLGLKHTERNGNPWTQFRYFSLSRGFCKYLGGKGNPKDLLDLDRILVD